MELLQAVGQQIRFHRHRQGFSQEHLAQQAGMNTSYLGQIERAEKNPTIITLEKIAKALNVSLVALITEVIEEKGCESSYDMKQVLALFTPDDFRKYVAEMIKSEISTTDQKLM